MTVVDLDLTRTTCWCGIPFMLPTRLLEQAVNHKHTIYCPHGHALSWKESESERLLRRAQRAEQENARLQDELRIAAEAEKKLKRRVGAGTCPCCQRTFANMARHMQSKHPEYGNPRRKK